MADWMPKDPVTLAEITGAVGSAGLLGKFWDSIFAWRVKKIDHAKDLQTIVDERLKLLLDADDKRLAQMSGAIDSQSKEIEALKDETSGLKTMIRTLIHHISSLEHLLRTKQIEPPPRPDLTVG